MGEADIQISDEKVRDAADQITKRVTDSILELRRLFLVGDFIDTLKFALLLWFLTYVGSWFNGMTLLILGLVAIFSIPKFYETNKAQIDEYVNLAKSHSVFPECQLLLAGFTQRREGSWMQDEGLWSFWK